MTTKEQIKMTIKEQIQKLNYAIFGEGTIGLKERVTKHEERLDKVEKILWLELAVAAAILGDKIIELLKHLF